MLTAVPVPGKEKSRLLCQAFASGAPRDAEGFVFYGVTQGNLASWRHVLRSGADWFYIDNAYFDATRGKRFRVTKNRLQVRAVDFESDGRRFDALGIALQPWQRNYTGHWLAVRQSPAFGLLADHEHWLTDTVRSVGGEHQVRWREWSADKAAQAATLAYVMAGAWAVITHTSAAAVQAVIAGVPIIVSEEHALARMVCSTHPEEDQRRRFLSALADHEFTINELKDGTAWRRLNP
jgi:hypothetical protein